MLKGTTAGLRGRATHVPDFDAPIARGPRADRAASNRSDPYPTASKRLAAIPLDTKKRFTASGPPATTSCLLYCTLPLASVWAGHDKSILAEGR